MGRNGKMKASPPPKDITPKKGKCEGGVQTMEIRYGKGGMTDSCGRSMKFEPPKPYNPDTDKSKPVPLGKKYHQLKNRGRGK